MIVLLACDGAEVPSWLVAVTVKVYAVPEVNPVKAIGDVVPVTITLPGEDVAVYCVIGYQPFEDGISNVTVAVVVPVFVAVPIIGASGTVASVVIELLGSEALEVPSPFVAVTVNV